MRNHSTDPNGAAASDGLRELSGREVRFTCDPNGFSFETTAELEAPDAMIGQERAERSLDFGVDIKSPGFNIFAVGLPGTGRTSMILERLRAVARELPTPDDWCYAYNFAEPHRPRALRLPAGSAPAFGRRTKELVDALRTEIPRAFETDEYQDQRNRIGQGLQGERREAMQALELEAKAVSFALIQTPVGLTVAPLADDAPLSAEDLAALSAEQRTKLDEMRKTLEDALARTMRTMRSRQREAREQIREMSCKVASSVVGPLVDELREDYPDSPAILAYLEDFKAQVTDEFEAFRDREDEEQQGPRVRMSDPFLPYQVNVLVTHEPGTGAPLLRESHPTFPNLMGDLEQRAEFGAIVTDFTMIKAGALHKANGGFLVLDVEDVLRAGVSYDGLKRSLRDGVIRIESVAESVGMATTTRLDPEPIPLDLKVAMVGPPHLYYMLHELDPDFAELFKVRAEFETEIELDDANRDRFASFIAARCRAEKLLHFDRTAVARVVEEGVRLAQDRSKLSTRFGDLSDIIREAEYWARRRKASVVTEKDVWASIDERLRRSNMVETKLREHIAEGTIMVDVEGSTVGQINGLSVLQMGGHVFGQPNRITVRAYPGRDGVISIDREAKLSGPIHDKGAMILGGFISGTFGGDGPLNLSATVVFEQSYGGIEGDSASLAELCALISALSGYALRQDLAMTGSVNQHGRVQAVGGVTNKVEGFFDLCQQLGLSGTQGVIIPASNTKNLTLRWAVAKAIDAGEFHLYAVQTVADAVELLSGHAAGAPDIYGKYPHDSAFGAVQARLELFARRWHDGPPH